MAESLEWYAADDLCFMRNGPYKTQAEAWSHMVLTEEEQKKQRSVHSKGARVWPEKKNKKGRG